MKTQNPQTNKQKKSLESKPNRLFSCSVLQTSHAPYSLPLQRPAFAKVAAFCPATKLQCGSPCSPKLPAINIKTHSAFFHHKFCHCSITLGKSHPQCCYHPHSFKLQDLSFPTMFPWSRAQGVSTALGVCTSHSLFYNTDQ